MGKAHRPRAGSMQFWPRKRAKKETPRVRSWAKTKEALPLGFAGYKAGMTHITVVDNRKTSKTKGEEVCFPVTVVECPAIKILSARLYKDSAYGLKLIKEINFKRDKEVEKTLPKLTKINEKAMENIKPEDFDELRINVYTQPKNVGFSKKKPEIFEVALGGNKEEQINYIKENKGKEINITDIFKPGQQIDICSVTKGKGFQGPVKRFGISIKSHKSEKAIRNPGSLGSWRGQGHMMYRVAHAGKMGYHTRTEYNKQILMMGDNPEDVNPKGGFLRYGLVKNPYILIKGSIGGSGKRLVRMIAPRRENKKMGKEAPTIVEISTESMQGN